MSLSHLVFDTLPPNGIAGQYLTCGGPGGPGTTGLPIAYWSGGGGVVPAGLFSPAIGMFYTVGTGPGTVAAGQPVQFNSAFSPSAMINTVAVQGPFSASGSVISIPVAGTYAMSYQMNPQANGSAVLYYGATLAGMVVEPQTASGSQTATDVIGGNFLLTCAANSFVALCAMAGNAAPLNPYANASTTNAACVNLTIVRVA